MEIELFAEPSCPFTWVVARWLRSSATASGDHLVIRPLSLGIVNAGDESVPEPYAGQQAAGVRALRVMESVRESAGVDTATAFFFEVAGRFHLHGDVTFAGLGDAVEAVAAPAAVLEAADDPAGDDVLRTAIADAARALGEPSGSPVLHLPAVERAFWGPILQSVPGPDDGVRMLSSLTTLASIAEFGQVKGTTGDLVVA